MFNRILWATDGSAAADHALPWVKDLAAERNSTVVVCHSVLTCVQVDALAADGVDAELRMVGGDSLHGAAHEIVRVAHEEGADLIVAGTRGHTVLGGLLLGSVTLRLLHLAGCPVLVIPTRIPDEPTAEGAGAEQAVA